MCWVDDDDDDVKVRIRQVSRKIFIILFILF